MSLRAIIVDDELPARLMIKGLASNHQNIIEIIGEASNGEEAIRLINEAKPDVLFLDIELGGTDGFSVLATIGHQPFIIFTTAYEEYAVKAFENNSIDYLVKPVEEERFARSMEKLVRFSKMPALAPNEGQLKTLLSRLQQNKKPTAIPIKTGNKFTLVRFEEVLYLEAREKYVFVITIENQSHLSDTTLAAFEEQLPPNFIRVQKSFIINTDHVYELHRHFGNRLIVVMNDRKKTRITTGITYTAKVKEKFGL